MKKTKRIAFCGVLAALAFGFSYIEMLIPLDFITVPGIKLGLANLAVMIVLYRSCAADAFIVSIVRLVISFLLFGSITTFIFSLTGAMLSLVVMVVMKKIKIFGKAGVSVAGGCFHNIGQLLAASLIGGNFAVFCYLPVLLICGALTGFFNGILLTLIINKTEK